MKKIFCLLAVAVLMGFAGSASAAGAYVGTGLGYSFPGFNGDMGDFLDSQEGGFSWEYLHVGYNFTDNIGVNLLWGQAAGTADIGEDADWTNDYLDVNLRYTFKMDAVSPYIEAGLGSYTLSAESDHVNIDLDPVLGYRLGVGGIIPISSFYVAPEFSYHWAEFDEGDIHISGMGSGSVSNAGGGDFGLLSLKIGYMFGGKK